MFASVRLSDLPHFTRVVMVSFPQLKKSKKEGAYQDELLLSSVKQQVSSDSLYNKESFIEKVSTHLHLQFIPHNKTCKALLFIFFNAFTVHYSIGTTIVLLCNVI